MADLKEQTDMTERTCSIPGCPKTEKSKGWCRKHYTAWYRHGDPLYGQDRLPPGTAGVYSITCLANGWVYIGESGTVQQRWTTHRSWLRNGTHNVEQLQTDYNRYGGDAFLFEMVSVVEVLVERRDCEQGHISTAKATGKCYNPDPGGQTYRLNGAQRQHLSASLKGKPKSAEHRANLWRDREVTDQFRDQMAANGRKGAGREKSAETRLRMSAAQETRVVLTEPQVREIKRLLAESVLSGAAIGRQFKVKPAAISAIRSGRNWAHVTLDAPAAVEPGGQQVLMIA